MNVKKTIASIAAIAMVASATSLAPLFTGTSIAATDETITDGATDLNEEQNTDVDENNEIDGVPALQDVTSITPTVDGMTSGRGTATGEVDGNSVTVNVALTSPVGAPQKGEANGTPNYHITIPVGNVEGWSFDGGYTLDSNDNPTWNLASDGLKLWLPVPAEGQSKTHTITIKSSDNSQTKTITIVAQNGEPVVAPTLTLGGSGSVDQGATGTVAVDGTTVTVTLTAGEGLGENGNDNARKNYHVVIPVTNLDSTWEFDASSEYGYDSNANKDWNITAGQLKLWLPVESGTCKVVLVKNGTRVTINVTTVNGSTVVTPPPVVTEPTEPTDAEKVAAAVEGIGGVLSTDSYAWVNVSQLEGWAANGIVSDLKAKVAERFSVDAEMTLDSYTVGDNGLVIMLIKVKVGDVEEVVPVQVQCTDDRTPVVPDVPVTIPDPIIYVPSASASVSSGAAAVTTVSSAKEITASRRSDIIVNAAETEVTPTMVEAFVKNKNSKTLTLQYGSDLKVSVSKGDITAADASFDFSVTGEKFLSSKTIKNNKVLKNAKSIVQIDFVNKGDLDGIEKATIKSKVGIGYAGRTVTIYEYKNGKLVKVGVAKVNGAGLVKFNTDHLGQFVIAVQ